MNSIVALNDASIYPDLACTLDPSSGFNLIGVEPGLVRNPDDGGDGWVDDPSTPGVDESANNDYGDLHLAPGSPAFNAGSDALAVDAQGAPLATDLDGKQRIIHGQVDVGAYEYCLVGDANYDGSVSDLDVSLLAPNWQQQSGATWADGDFTGDGKVNDLDVSLLALNWQQTLEAAVPETAPVVEPLGVVMVDTAMVGPRQVSASLGMRRALEPVRASEGDSPVFSVSACSDGCVYWPKNGTVPREPLPRAHDAALAEEFGEAELTRCRLAWSLEFARTHGPERPADRPGPARRTVDLILAMEL